ncbi:MAG: hypothetical protein KGJ43_01065, partial [Acidobacteriota bacterium]|nr:hypothetical protein [Acidobacteriota bacterium]
MREDATAATVDLGAADLPQGATAVADGAGAEPPKRTGLATWTDAHIRFLHGMRRPNNWLQLVRFSLVGA